MACPVVSGIAALIMSYYPALSAKEVKAAIEESVAKVDDKVKLPGSDEETFLIKISGSGGIVNAYNAVVKADEMSKKVIKPAASAAPLQSKPKAPATRPAPAKKS